MGLKYFCKNGLKSKLWEKNSICLQMPLGLMCCYLMQSNWKMLDYIISGCLVILKLGNYVVTSLRRGADMPHSLRINLSPAHIYTRTHKGQAPSAPYHVPKQSVHNSWAPHQLKRGKDSFTCSLFKTLLAIGEQPQHSWSFNKQAHLKYWNISLITCLQLCKQSRIVYLVNLFVTQVTS